MHLVCERIRDPDEVLKGHLGIREDVGDNIGHFCNIWPVLLPKEDRDEVVPGLDQLEMAYFRVQNDLHLVNQFDLNLFTV